METGRKEPIQRFICACISMKTLLKLQRQYKKKHIAFYHDKDVKISQLSCTLPKLANICLHQSGVAKSYPFTEGDKEILDKTSEDVVGGPFVVLTLKAVIDESFVRKPAKLCKSIVEIDAHQLFHYSMSPPKPTGINTDWDLNSDTTEFTPRQNNTAALNICSCRFFKEQEENIE